MTVFDPATTHPEGPRVAETGTRRSQFVLAPQLRNNAESVRRASTPRHVGNSWVAASTEVRRRRLAPPPSCRLLMNQTSPKLEVKICTTRTPRPWYGCGCGSYQAYTAEIRFAWFSLRKTIHGLILYYTQTLMDVPKWGRTLIWRGPNPQICGAFFGTSLHWSHPKTETGTTSAVLEWC